MTWRGGEEDAPCPLLPACRARPTLQGEARLCQRHGQAGRRADGQRSGSLFSPAGLSAVFAVQRGTEKVQASISFPLRRIKYSMQLKSTFLHHLLGCACRDSGKASVRDRLIFCHCFFLKIPTPFRIMRSLRGPSHTCQFLPLHL